MVDELIASRGDANLRMGYATALRLVRDLLGRGDMARMRDALLRLGRGESPSEAIPRAYGIELDALERRWASLLR